MTEENRPASTLPSALESKAELGTRLRKLGTIFLDYDGTLSPIVAHPEDAHISESTRHLLEALAGRFTVAVVSGRSVDDVRERVGVEQLIYAGSHGHEIEFPGGERYEHPGSQISAPALGLAQDQLNRLIDGVDGATVEAKPFSIAVHTRNAPGNEARNQAETIVTGVAEEAGLVVRRGKEVLELRPNVKWDKGSAIQHISGGLDSNKSAIFIGDDETDEDGFEVMQRMGGIGILVGPPDQRMTAARYRLDDPEAVIGFLSDL